MREIFLHVRCFTYSNSHENPAWIIIHEVKYKTVWQTFDCWHDVWFTWDQNNQQWFALFIVTLLGTSVINNDKLMWKKLFSRNIIFSPNYIKTLFSLHGQKCFSTKNNTVCIVLMHFTAITLKWEFWENSGQYFLLCTITNKWQTLDFIYYFDTPTH